MKLERLQIEKAIVRLAELVPTSALLSFCERLERVKDIGDSRVEMSLTAEVAQPLARQTLAELLRLSNSTQCQLTAKELSWAIRGALAVVETRIAEEAVELVWTGPSDPQTTMRRTDQALLDLIEGAQEELLIVTFAAYKIRDIVSAMLRATSRNVDITLVLESTKENAGRLDIDARDAMGKELLSKVKMYCWPSDRRPKDGFGRHGSLHAKCAVADNCSALVSSANLTEYAMSLNMELGVVVRGGDVPQKICAHFRKLMDDGHLLPFEVMP